MRPVKFKAFIFFLALVGLSSTVFNRWEKPIYCFEQTNDEEQSPQPQQLDVAQVLVGSAHFFFHPCSDGGLDWFCQADGWVLPFEIFPPSLRQSPKIPLDFVKALFRGYIVKNAP